MKILHVASGGGWGGLEQVVALLAEGVGAEPGFDVEALLFNEGRLATVLRERGVAVHVIPESDHTFLTLTRATRQWIETRDPDVVHAHRYKEILATALAISWSRRGFVVTLHGLQPSEQLPRSESLLIWSTLLIARVAGARFVGVSSELAKRLARVVGRRRVAHIHNPMPIVRMESPVPDLRSQLGWSEAKPLVGFVGRLEHVKGPDLLLDIAERTKSDAGFVVIGTGSLDRELRMRTSKMARGDRIAFLGEIPNASRYIRQFDVLSLPSRHEGLPLVLLEAASSSVPVVAFDVGGVREILGDGGMALRLIPPTDVDAFAASIDNLLAERAAMRSDLERWARAVRSRFSLEWVSEQYREIYRAGTRA